MNANRLVITFSLVWIVVKMIFFLTGDTGYSLMIGTLANIFFILALIATSLYYRYREIGLAESSVIKDLKYAMNPAGKYILLICGFIFVYYSFIDQAFLPERLAVHRENVEMMVQDEVAFQAWKDEDPARANVTTDDIVAQRMEMAEFLHRPSTILGGGLLVLTVLAMFYSMVVSVLFRKVLLK